MSDIKGKIVLKTPFICECCIRSDSADTWAWESDKAIEIGENALLISIKRKWHLFRPVTVEAEIIK